MRILDESEASSDPRPTSPLTSKVGRIFGLASQSPLVERLARMAAWARRVGIQSARAFEGSAVTRHLPPSWTALLTAPASKSRAA